MESITRKYVAPFHGGSVGFSDHARRALKWIERAHSRRPRQEFWQWLHQQLDQNRALGK